MNNIQHAIQTLERYSQSLALSTERISQIFRNKGITSVEVEIPKDAPSCNKLAISGVIVDLENAMREAASLPDNIQIAIQLAKVGSKIKLGVPGGAILSSEEQFKIDSEYRDKPAPGNLFYHIAQEQLINTGTLNFSYPDELVNSSFNHLLKQNLIRELGEEMGQRASDNIRIETILPDERKTILRTIGLPNTESIKLIAEKLCAKGVSINSEGKLEGVYTTVRERVAIITGSLGEIQEHATENEEAEGMQIFSVEDLVAISENSSQDIESFDSYRTKYESSHDGIRNPSTTWALKLAVDWILEKVKNFI